MGGWPSRKRSQPEVLPSAPSAPAAPDMAGVVTVRVYPFDDEIKEAVMARMLDGENDFLPRAWEMFSKNPKATLFRADLDGRAVGVFFSIDQGRGEAFLNGLRTDSTVRRKGIATNIIRFIDAEHGHRGFTHIRLATVSNNDPMISLCQDKLGLSFTQFKFCVASERSEGPGRLIRLDPTPEELSSVVDKLEKVVMDSEYLQKSSGMLMSSPGQFRRMDRAEIEERVTSKHVVILGSMDSVESIRGLAILSPSPWGNFMSVHFLAGPDLAETMDELRVFVPPRANPDKTPAPPGPGMIEGVGGYMPIGSQAYEFCMNKTPLPFGAFWECPRPTMENVTGWVPGTLKDTVRSL